MSKPGLGRRKEIRFNGSLLRFRTGKRITYWVIISLGIILVTFRRSLPIQKFCNYTSAVVSDIGSGAFVFIEAWNYPVTTTCRELVCASSSGLFWVISHLSHDRETRRRERESFASLYAPTTPTLKYEAKERKKFEFSFSILRIVSFFGEEHFLFAFPRCATIYCISRRNPLSLNALTFDTFSCTLPLHYAFLCVS